MADKSQQPESFVLFIFTFFFVAECNSMYNIPKRAGSYEEAATTGKPGCISDIVASVSSNPHMHSWHAANQMMRNLNDLGTTLICGRSREERYFEVINISTNFTTHLFQQDQDKWILYMLWHGRISKLLSGADLISLYFTHTLSPRSRKYFS